jgi:hypothetical protein
VSWHHGPWRLVARLTHLDAGAQSRLWRLLLAAWCAALATAWGVLAVLTHAQEKASAEAGRTYVMAAPLAAEVMDLRARRGQFESHPPLLAAEQVAAAAGIDESRLHIAPAAGDAPAPDAGGAIALHARGLTLRELVEVLRDLKVEAGLGTVSAQLTPSPGQEQHMDLDMVLAR